MHLPHGGTLVVLENCLEIGNRFVNPLLVSLTVLLLELRKLFGKLRPIIEAFLQPLLVERNLHTKPYIN